MAKAFVVTCTALDSCGNPVSADSAEYLGDEMGKTHPTREAAQAAADALAASLPSEYADQGVCYSVAEEGVYGDHWQAARPTLLCG